MKVRTRDVLERVLWTAVTASLANLGGVAFGVEFWEAAALTGAAAALNAVLTFARWRLSVLPDPGAAVSEFGVAAGYAQGLEDAPNPP